MDAVPVRGSAGALRASALNALRDALVATDASETEALLAAVAQLSDQCRQSRFWRHTLKAQSTRILPLLDLPNKLVESVLKQIDSVDAILRCESACRAWRVFFRNPAMDASLWRRLAYEHGVTNLTDKGLRDASLPYMLSHWGSYGMETLAVLETSATTNWREFLMSRARAQLSFGYDAHYFVSPYLAFDFSLTVWGFHPDSPTTVNAGFDEPNVRIGWSGRARLHDAVSVLAATPTSPEVSIDSLTWGAMHSACEDHTPCPGCNPHQLTAWGFCEFCRGEIDAHVPIGIEFEGDSTEVLCFQVSVHPKTASQAIADTLLLDFRIRVDQLCEKRYSALCWPAAV